MLIQRMRDGSEGVLAKVIIGLIIIVFGLFGFGSITTFLAPVPKVATVNGSDVTQQEMELAVERNRRLLLARGVPLDKIDEDQLRENVLDGLVSRQLLSQAAEEFDLYFSDEAIDEEIVSSDIFQIDGVFNTNQFQNVIRSAGYTPMGYRDEMRTDKLFEQMSSGMRQSAFVTEAESKRYSALLSQTRDLAYLQVRVAELLDEVVVSDEEIDDYYAENAGEFVTEEMVNLQYVELKHEQLAESLEVEPEALEQYYRDHLGEYSTDESRRVAHILIETSDELPEAAAKQKADEAYERIKQGEDFSALARELSDDIGSKENGGDLGFNPQGTFFPEFEAVAYDLALNQVSAPVATDIGFHIIKVLEIDAAVVPTLDDIRAEVEQAYRMYATEDAFVTTSARLAEMLFESIDLEVPATELGLEIKTTGLLARDAKQFPLDNTQVLTAAFSADVLLDGNNSDLIEISDADHLGIRVIEHVPSTTRTLAEVTEDIRYILQRAKAHEMALARADAIVTAIRGGSLSQYVADEYGLQWVLQERVSRFSREVDPQVLREAFKLPRPASDQESLGTAILPNGDSLVLRVSGVTNLEGSELVDAEIAGVRDNLASQMGMMDFQEFQDSLATEASIERVN